MRLKSLVTLLVGCLSLQYLQANLLDGDAEWFDSPEIRDDNWVYHDTHDWLYLSGSDIQSIWMWSLADGWFWTGKDPYPILFNPRRDGWAQYVPTTKKPRLYFNFHKQAWETELEMESLSGLWTGIRETFQTGDCLVGGSNYSVNDVAYMIEVQGNVLIVKVEVREGVWATFFQGTISNLLAIAMDRDVTSICNGESVERTDHYEGRVKFTDYGLQITIVSHQVWCPEMGCSFDLVYTLAKR